LKSRLQTPGNTSNCHPSVQQHAEAGPHRHSASRPADARWPSRAVRSPLRRCAPKIPGPGPEREVGGGAGDRRERRYCRSLHETASYPAGGMALRVHARSDAKEPLRSSEPAPPTCRAAVSPTRRQPCCAWVASRRTGSYPSAEAVTRAGGRLTIAARLAPYCRPYITLPATGIRAVRISPCRESVM